MDDAHVTATEFGRCLVVTAGQDLSDQALGQLQRLALDGVSARGLRAVVLDLSAVQVLDAHEFACLRTIAAMLRLLGADTLFAGLRPAVIAYLMSADVDVSGLQAAQDLDAAMNQLATLA